MNLAPDTCVILPVRSASTLLPLVHRLLGPLVAVAALLAMAGCASVETRKVGDLSRLKHVFVEHRLTDDRHLDEMLTQELTKLGYSASYGPLTMLPDNADAVLSYEDRWEWDFKTYLIELKVTVHTARTNKKLAEGSYYQPTPNSKPPAEVVNRVLVPIFAKK